MFGDEEFKEYEKKFRKTTKGKKYYIMNLSSILLFAISLILMLIVVFNEGNVLTSGLIFLIIIAFMLTACASALCMIYCFMLDRYIREKKTSKVTKKG